MPSVLEENLNDVVKFFFFLSVWNDILQHFWAAPDKCWHQQVGIKECISLYTILSHVFGKWQVEVLSNTSRYGKRPWCLKRWGHGGVTCSRPNSLVPHVVECQLMSNQYLNTWPSGPRFHSFSLESLKASPSVEHHVLHLHALRRPTTE